MITGAPVSVDDFIPAGTNTETTDVSTYIALAIAAMPSSYQGTLQFTGGKAYNIGSGAVGVLINKSMVIEGNGALLLYDSSATGRAVRVNANFVYASNLTISKPTFSTTNTGALTGTGLELIGTGSQGTLKCIFRNISITGYAYGTVLSSEGVGVSYIDFYSHRVRFCKYGMVFDATDSVNSFCTGVNVYGGEISLGGYSTVTGSRCIDIRNSTTYTTTNGINFYGTIVEGQWERKLRCEGINNSFNNLYWEQPTGGTDIEFVNNGTSGQLSKNNIIVAGNNLSAQVIVNTSGEVNSVVDPLMGVLCGNPVGSSTKLFNFTQKSASGSGVFAVIGNSGTADVNTTTQLELHAKKSDQVLVSFGSVAATVVNPSGDGNGLITLFARNSAGYSIGTIIGDGETGNVYPELSAVGTLGTTTNKWKSVYAKNGIVVTTPDNTNQYVISVDNSGNVITTLV